MVVIIVDGENDGDYGGNNDVGEMVITMVVVVQMMCSGN